MSPSLITLLVLSASPARGLKFHDVPYDGDCLFSAVALSGKATCCAFARPASTNSVKGVAGAAFNGSGIL